MRRETDARRGRGAIDEEGGQASDLPQLPLVSFIIPVLNDAHGLRRCIESIAANDYRPGSIEILVADNGSLDSSPQVAREMGAMVLELPAVSVAALRNRAARESHGEVLAFVDADHELDAQWISSAVADLREPRVAAVGAPYYPPPEPTWVQRGYDSLRDHRPGRRDVRWVGSGNLAVRRRVFEQAEGFDESITTCEDVDFCARLRARGLRVLSDSRLRSVHYGDPRTLRALFRSELWRGRDNLRVSLRTYPSVREMPSIVMPVFNLACLVALMAGTAATSLGGSWYAVGGFLGLVLTSSLRAAWLKASERPPGGVGWLRAFGFASVYEVARALALVARARHRSIRAAKESE